jgi:hypothetical protein
MIVPVYTPPVPTYTPWTNILLEVIKKTYNRIQSFLFSVFSFFVFGNIPDDAVEIDQVTVTREDDVSTGTDQIQMVMSEMLDEEAVVSSTLTDKILNSVVEVYYFFHLFRVLLYNVML